MNFGALPMCNGLTRLESRFQGEPERVEELRARIGEQIDASTADELASSPSRPTISTGTTRCASRSRNARRFRRTR